MSDGTGIERTEATWNPSLDLRPRVAGCDSCYALTMARRLKRWETRSTRTTVTRVTRPRFRADSPSVPT